MASRPEFVDIDAMIEMNSRGADDTLPAMSPGHIEHILASLRYGLCAFSLPLPVLAGDENIIAERAPNEILLITAAVA